MFGDEIKYKCKLCWWFINGVSDRQQKIKQKIVFVLAIYNVWSKNENKIKSVCLVFFKFDF